ncbi:MAG: glycosyltransferase family 39 protein [Candidatus Shapirobacteria bacterium]|nr:glycosyltransferase family 39 protein [Candidatus Shapirobacteria bacterium]MDD4410555.1 glycosyltransferase family 39 protein [Candidatus Shapirobacteria bacterium]
MWKKNYILILILILAIFLRFFRLDYLELFGDEIDAGYQSYSLLETGRDYKGHLLPLYAQSFSEWRAPMMMYFMIPFIKIFGLNEFGVRSYSAFFGIVSILGIYFLLMKIGVKKKISLMTVFLITILPWHIQYSRSAFEVTLMSSFIIWGSYFLIDYFNKHKFYKLFLAAVLLSLSFYTYNTANIYVPLLILIIFTGRKFFTKEKIFKPAFKLLIIMFVLSLPILYQIFFGTGAERFKKVSLFNNDNLVSEINDYRKQQNYSLVSKIFYNKVVYSVRIIGANYLNAFSSDYLFGMGDVTFRHSLHKTGNLFWVYGIFLIVGIIFFIKNKKKNFGDYFMLGFLIISPIPSSLTIDGAYHATRLFLMFFPLAYFAAIGFCRLFEYKKYIGVFLSLILFFEFSYFQYYYWNSYKQDSWRWWHYGYKEIMKSVVELENDYEKVLIENTYEPALPRYLFWSKYNPQRVFSLKDQNNEKIDGFEGFCLDNKDCFVNFGDGIFNVKNMVNNHLYMISQSLNIGGDWYWNENPPAGVKVLKTVRNPIGEPLFYLITKNY